MSQTINVGQQLARSLSLAFRAFRLYPAGHPQRTKAEFAVESMWSALLAHTPEVVIDLVRHEIRAGNSYPAPLGQALQPEILTAARSAGLNELRFEGRGGAERVLAVLELLTQAPGRVRAEAGLPALRRPESDATYALTRYWNSISQHRTREAVALSAVLEFVGGQTGDGLVRPVALIGGAGDSHPVHEHALDVARLAMLAGRALGMDAAALAQFGEAALAMDLGMTAVPAEILGRPLRLDKDEFRSIRVHPLVGSAWLLATPEVPPLAGVLAFEHHLREDGRGYPQLSAPWPAHPLARIVQVCDTYAALRSERPFRPPLGETEARQLLRRLAGTALDAEAVELLLTRAAPAGCVTQNALATA